jgi:hypothetical protein
VTVRSGLLHKSGVDGIALLEVLLRRSELGDQAGDPGLGAGVLSGLADAVEDVCGGNAANGDVEAALLDINHVLATGQLKLGVLWSSSETSRLAARGGKELTPKPSLTGSAWAEWEPKRRGGCCAASRRDEAAKRLAANMVEGELEVIRVVMTFGRP